MCRECWSTPCHPNCPNAHDTIVRGVCVKCEEELVEGYEYYMDNDENKFCSINCAMEYHDVEPKEWRCE